VLERKSEAGQLGGRVRLRSQEGADIESTDAHRGVLESRPARVVGLKARVHQALLLASLLEMLAEHVGEQVESGNPLSGLSQTSVLSVGSDRIDTERLQLCFELEESTSASALLLSSIDGARRQFVREGTQLLDRAVKSAHLLRDRLASEVPELRVITPQELAARPGVVGVDPTHVLLETEPIGLTGYQADDWLRDERQIDVELVDHRRIMALVTFAHGEAEVERFVSALRGLVDARAANDGGSPVRKLPSRSELRTEQAMLPREAFFAAAETVAADRALGRVSAELVTPYPPGIPTVVPGEVYTEATVSYLQELVANGAFVEGATDPTLGQLRVTKPS
jgi:arginine decarboxylase